MEKKKGWRRRPGGSPEKEVEEEIGGLGSVEGEGRRNRGLVDGRGWRLDGSPEVEVEMEGGRWRGWSVEEEGWWWCSDLAAAAATAA